MEGPRLANRTSPGINGDRSIAPNAESNNAQIYTKNIISVGNSQQTHLLKEKPGKRQPIRLKDAAAELYLEANINNESTSPEDIKNVFNKRIQAQPPGLKDYLNMTKIRLELKAELIAELRKGLTDEAKKKTAEVMLKSEGRLSAFAWGAIKKLFMERARELINNGATETEIYSNLKTYCLANEIILSYDKYGVGAPAAYKIHAFITESIGEMGREIEKLYDEYHNSEMKIDNNEEDFLDKMMRKVNEHFKNYIM